MMFRNTYVQINQKKLYLNVKNIIDNYPNYNYYIGIVKNNAYSHGIECIASMLDAGINYLAVSSLDEAIQIRNLYPSIPILILEPIHLNEIDIAIKNNITITVDNLSYLEELLKIKLKKQLKIHFKIDTGMNRLGFKEKKDLLKSYNLVNENNKIFLEGIYTHFATAGRYDIYYEKQLNKFYELTEEINLNKIPIVHIDRSLTFVSHEKPSYINGVRLGIIMYGFSGSTKPDNSLRGKLSFIKRKMFFKKNNISFPILQNNLNLQPVFSLYSEVISIRKVKASERVGYNASYIVKEDGYIATISIGYADGVTQKFKNVIINNKKYEIVGDSMDMLMVLVDKSVKIGDKVEIFGDKVSIHEITNILGINSYHLFNQITTRVPRITYKK